MERGEKEEANVQLNCESFEGHLEEFRWGVK